VEWFGQGKVALRQIDAGQIHKAMQYWLGSNHWVICDGLVVESARPWIVALRLKRTAKPHSDKAVVGGIASDGGLYWRWHLPPVGTLYSWWQPTGNKVVFRIFVKGKFQ
jgi:hypothetical protein